MKIRRLFLFFALLWIGCFSLSAQVLVSVNKTIHKDTLLTTVQKNSLASKTLYASGQVVFSSQSGYVRILLSDDYGYDLLIYESSPLLAVNGVDNFSNSSMEAVDIPSNLLLTKVRVEIKSAVLNNLSVNMTNAGLSKSQQKQARTDRIALINRNLRAQNMLWTAGETSISQMSYEEKKELFGGKVLDLQGYEYYIGGIFELNSDSLASNFKNTQATTRSSYVSSFDWRNRHGRNWLTSVKNQGGCGSCSIFAAIGATEALVNLYYNQPLNLDLAEQQIVSCASDVKKCANGGGWAIKEVIDYIRTNGIVIENEFCFPYTATDLPCSNIMCPNPLDIIKIGGRVAFDGDILVEGGTYYPLTEESLKKMIIKHGPLSGIIWSLNHAMTLVGYGTIQAGDTVYLGMTEGLKTPIIISTNDARIGETYWIFKNSHGTDWGSKGYGYFKVNVNDMRYSVTNGTFALLPPITSPNYTDADIVCEDRDGDGYYYWGIGPKPASCPLGISDEPDGDDSNPCLGPMDEYGNCAVITPLVDNITTSQTWNTNRTISNSIVIPSGVTLTITAKITVSPCRTITIQNGGKLILNGGTIDSAYILAKNGGKLTILNNGKILLESHDNLEIELGAEFDMDYGEILLK